MPPREPEEAVTVAPEGDGLAVQVGFTGVGRLYQGFFADEAPLRALGAALVPCVRGPVRVSVTYDEPSRMGRVALVLTPDQLACRATHGPGDAWDVSPLVPVAQALATWRNGVAAQRDMRIYAFRTGIHLVDPWGHATLWLDGQDPVDGTAFHRCLGLDGFDRCEAGGERDGVRAYRVADARLANRVVDLFGAR